MNWHERILNAQDGGFTIEDKELAADWVTCACGEQDDIPRSPLGIPRDGKLSSLGCSFASAVTDDNPKHAALILKAIEKRAQEVQLELARPNQPSD